MKKPKKNTVLTQHQIFNFYKEGLIPGPLETEEEFRVRAQFCLDFRNEWETVNEKLFPSCVERSMESFDSKKFLMESHQLTQKLYGIAPTWVPLFFSNYKLAPWHGGCAWFFNKDEESPTTAFIQLRAAFSAKQRYLGIYERNELITHEMAHIGRILFEEPKFEEILAFQSSSSNLRRYLGPVVQSSKESSIFISVLALALFINLAIPSMVAIIAVNFLPLALLFYGFGRLVYRQKSFSDCLKKLTSLLNDREKAHHLIYCLTDQEILDFAKWSPEQIHEYRNKQAKIEFRWQFLSGIFN
jgi:hypothetical protein